MKAFEYIACESLESALAALGTYPDGARILAGGTDLLLDLRRPGVPSPKAIIDISRISALRGITEVEGTVNIGPLTTHAEISRSDLVRRTAGCLAAAAGAIGSPQIRNRGTIGGNIVNAATCADTVPPLVALGARLTLCSGEGERTIATGDFFEKPYRTVARANEVLTAVRFDPLAPGARTAFVKLGRRNAVSIARLSVAAVLIRNTRGVITEARIVPGAALPVWKRMGDAEAMLIGEKPSGSLFAAVGRKVAEIMVGMTGRRWSTEYKEPVLAVLVRRSLEACCSE
jgi:CO/xanthine dehydrogenase FAD-binding subunit